MMPRLASGSTLRAPGASPPRDRAGIYSCPMSDEPTNDLVDGALADEIELVSDLVVAASTSPRHFTPEEIDALLGVSREDRDGPLGSEPVG